MQCQNPLFLKCQGSPFTGFSLFGSAAPMAIHNLALEWQTRGETFQILSSFQGLLHEYRAKTEREVSRTQSFTQPRWRLSGGEVVKFRSSNWTKSMKIPFIT